MLRNEFSDESLQIAIDTTHEQLKTWARQDSEYKRLWEHLGHLLLAQVGRVTLLYDDERKVR